MNPVSVTIAFKWAILKHTGTLAFGSFLVAVVTMIRVIFEYMVQKLTAAGAASNPMAKVAICASRCCLYFLDKCVKFINKTAYIQVALHNKAFCPAAW